MISRLATLAIVGLMLTACAAPTRFEWGGYENQLYRYYRNVDNREDYRNALEHAIQKGSESDRVAPGLNAELGFLAYEDGNEAEARRYFEAEMRLFPESRTFIQRYMQQGPVDAAYDAVPASTDDSDMDASTETPTS